MITDWLMVGITIVYVVATIAICLANIKSAKATREQVAEAKRQFEENNRAFVTVTFEIIRNGLLVLNMHNHGHQIANNVTIKINQDFIDSLSNNQAPEKLCKSSFTLGIDKGWYVFLGSQLDLDHISSIPLEIMVYYSDTFAEYSESTTIDLKQYMWSIIYNSPIEDTYNEMKKMTKSIQSIDKSVQRLQQNITDLEQN